MILNIYRILRLFKCPHKYNTYDTEPIFSTEKQRLKGRYSAIMNYQECVRCGNRRSIKT